MHERLTRLSFPVNIYHMQTDRCPPPDEAIEYHDRETYPDLASIERERDEWAALARQQQVTIAELQHELIIWKGKL